tara:strand:+ start:8060 stop:9463 length:1404 start_codon:yes stop_codon:yes gene_type:complete
MTPHTLLNLPKFNINRATLLIFTSAIVLCTAFSPAFAANSAQDQQPTQQPTEILELSRAALGEIPGFTAQFSMEGVGGALFADTFPSMNGQLFFGTNDEHGRVLRSLGNAKEMKTAPTKPMDMLISEDRYYWLDYEKKQIHETKNDPDARGTPGSFSTMLIKPIILDDPFAKDLNNAVSVELLEQASVKGVLCDVIEITRPEKPKGRTRKSRDDAYTSARWYISTVDRLPRKLEHKTDAGIIQFTFVLELANVKVIENEQDKLDINRPSEFEFVSSIPKPKPDPTTETNDEPLIGDTTNQDLPPDFVVTDNQPDPQPVIKRNKRAPAYAFTPAAFASTEVNNATQANKVTVLYFWGSWCIPCAETSPLVSQMAFDFLKDPVDVFGLAIREADTAATQSEFDAEDFMHTLVFDAGSLVSDFKVRVFPTIVVINASGEIVFQEHISKQVSGTELIENAKAAVQEAVMNL